MNIRHTWLWLLVSFLCSQPMMGQQTVIDNDTIHTLYFHVGKSNFDPLFRGNAVVMNRMMDQIDLLCAQPQKAIRSIKVSTSTSPEGGKQLNVNLASDRSHSIVRYLMHMYPRLTQQIVISSELAPDWAMLRNLVSAGNMPMRNQVLEILDLYRGYYNPDYSAVDPRETHLKRLGNGSVWQYMLDNYFPDMRYAKVTLHHDLFDTNNPFLKEVVSEKTGKIGEKKQEEEGDTVIFVDDEPNRKLLLALKTNLLFDVIGAFNGEIEIPLAKRWSAQAEVIWPWYLHNRDYWSYQAGLIDGEIRYWPGGCTLGNVVDEDQERNPLTGYFFGLTGGWGYYDISDHRKGHQGELWAAGVTFGYSHRLWRNFNLEYSLGVGYVHSNYRRYHVNEIKENDYLVKKYSDHFDWIGPIKAKISLSWLIFNKKR